MFRTVRLSIIRSLFTVYSAMLYVIQVYRQLSSWTASCSKAVYKPVWHIPLLSIQWINSWWWKDELSEACSVSSQNKFVKLVHLFGFITKKFVTMQGHMNVKKNLFSHLSKTFILAATAPRRQALLTVEASRSHSDKPRSVVLLWTSDQPHIETSIWQHTGLARDRHPRPQRDSINNPSNRAAADPRFWPHGHWNWYL
jgi:hypothetical protein